MGGKKAQLSIETMIIYGLVILVSLSVIGGLFYFDIFDVGSYLPNQCDLGGTGDLRCEEMALSSSEGELRLGIRNSGQKPIASINVSVTDKTKVHFNNKKNTTVLPSSTLAPGDIAGATIPISPTSGEVLRGEVVAKYKYVDGAITQEAVGSIRIRAS